MKDHFWLIQRAKFWNIENATELFGGSPNHLVRPDYMGSAEFEFGAIPRAYRRIMGQFDQYNVHILNITNFQGVPFYLFCRDDRYEATVAELKSYMNNRYRLLEYSGIHAHLQDTINDNDKFLREINFWWCIDSHSDVGDWMLFLGSTDRYQAFLRCIQADYNNWWMKFPKEERDEMFDKAMIDRW